MTDYKWSTKMMTRTHDARCMVCGKVLNPGDEVHSRRGSYRGVLARAFYHKKCWESLLA